MRTFIDTCIVVYLVEGDVKVHAIALGRPIIDRATELRATSGMKPLDALHVATALETGCEAFWTNDLRLAGTKLALRFEAALANAPTTT